MRKRRGLVWTRYSLLTAAVSVLLFPASAVAASSHHADLSADALKLLIPEGYKVEKTMAYEADQRDQHYYLVALSDIDDTRIKVRPVMLLLVKVGKKSVIEDQVTPHDDGGRGKFWDGAPNYFSGMSKENLVSGDLFLVKTVLTAGGSGSAHYFDFYSLEKKKLRLVKSFSHGRIDETYFAVYKNAVYDAECVCTRGEKHGKAYVYICYLQVTKYTFDGRAISPVGSERMREQRGNRYLQDKYRFISVLKALQQNEIFAETP